MESVQRFLSVTPVAVAAAFFVFFVLPIIGGAVDILEAVRL